MSPFHERALHVGVPTHVKLDTFALQHVLKRHVREFLSPVRLQIDRPPAYGVFSIGVL